jgi:hypothetical protein
MSARGATEAHEPGRAITPPRSLLAASVSARPSSLTTTDIDIQIESQLKRRVLGLSGQGAIYG